MVSILRRFRRISPPGGAMAGIAPPEDPLAAHALELAELFDSLDAMQGEADAVLAAARLEAERIAAQADAAVEATLAAAADQAAAERAKASEAFLKGFASTRDDLGARASAQAAAVRSAGASTADAVASAVVEGLRALATGGGVDR